MRPLHPPVPAPYHPDEMTADDATAHPDTLEPLSGLIERVTFHNPESGFAVLQVKVRGHKDLVTCLGTLPEVKAGEWIEAQGCWIIDQEYGRQFRTATLRTAGFLQLDDLLHPDIVADHVHGNAHHDSKGDLVQIGPVCGKPHDHLPKLRLLPAPDRPNETRLGGYYGQRGRNHTLMQPEDQHR